MAEKLQLKWNKVESILSYYGKSSTVPTIANIAKGKTAFEKSFWLTCSIILIIFGMYWSVMVYLDWQGSQVLTIPLSTSRPLMDFPFPAITVCSKSVSSILTTSSFYKDYQDLMKTFGKTFLYSPIQAAKINSKLSLFNTRESELFQYNKPTYIGETNIVDLLYGNSFIQNYDYTLSQFTVMVLFYSIDTDVSQILTYISAHPNKTLPSVLNIYLQHSKQYFVNKLNSSGGLGIYTEVDFNVTFRHIWYTGLPCNDIVNLTAEIDLEYSMLKSCMWKQVAIPCQDIFTPSISDKGICCSFNIEKADHLYTSSFFSHVLADMQTKDNQSYFVNASVPEWYVESKEPISRGGLKMGLQVTLDSHYDQISRNSLSTDFNSFFLLVQDSSAFPLTLQNSIRIFKGHRNLISLTGKAIQTDESLRSINPNIRGCYFSNEATLQYYKSYKQQNCIFECNLNLATNYITEKYYTKCSAWFFPQPDNQRVCNTTITNDLLQFLGRDYNGKDCTKCLPNCNSVSYKAEISHEPFRNCDDLNLFRSDFCKLNINGSNYKPQLWYDQVLSQWSRAPLDSNRLYRRQRRTVTLSDSYGAIFSNSKKIYDSYANDIAVLNVYFDTGSVWVFKVSASYTWALYFSNISGLLGLAIGFCLVTIAEFMFFFLQIIKAVFN